ADARAHRSCIATCATSPTGTTGAVAAGSAVSTLADAAVRINNNAIGEIAIGGDRSVVCNRDVAACATSPAAACAAGTTGTVAAVAAVAAIAADAANRCGIP